MSTEEMVLDLYKNGIGGTQISKELKIGKRRVYKILNKNNCIPVPGKRNRFTKEQEEIIIKKYQEDGEGLESVAKLFNTNLCTIRNILIRNKVKVRKSGGQLIEMPDAEQQLLVQRWLDGKSQKELAEIHGVGQLTISRFLAKKGITKKQKAVKRERHGRWLGGKTKDGSGYVLIKLYNHDQFYDMSNSSGYVLEHRLVMARHLNRSLTNEETVHHINGARDDNRIENLQLRSGAHGKGQCHVCADCGSTNIVSKDI